jgi:type I restriction enzyme S subunit
MKLETFFEKFDQFADAPGAVAKMRELVLRLAFSGALTGKRQTDDGVPSGWESRTIESISASIASGFACSRSHQVENGHVHLRTHNISTLGTLNFDLLVRIDPKMVDPQKASIRAGDILFNNTNSQELVGKTSLVDRDYDYGFSNHITRIRLKDGIFPGFVVFYLTLLRNSGYFARLCTRWINQAAVNTDTLKEQIIPLPPLAEQKRIVAKVDELMALCDLLEAQLQDRETRHAALARASLARFADAPTPANLDFLFHDSYTITPADLRKSILTLAVRGRLVHQIAGVESGERLLEEIIAERLEAVRARRVLPMKPLPAVEADEVAYELRPGWALARLNELVMEIQTGPFGSSLHKSDYQLGGTPVINPASLKDGRIIPIEGMAIGPDTLNRLQVFKLNAGDIVMARRGEMGRCAIVTNREEGWLCGTGSLVLRMPTSFYAPFLAMVIGAPEAREYLGGTSVGTTMQNLNQSILARMPVGVPPLAEQRRIVAKVDQLMTLVDQLEAQLTQSHATSERLMDALVAELTNQD